MSLISSFPVWSLVSAGAILLFGFFIFLYLFLKSYKKHRAIVHYERIRDELTLRNEELEEDIEIPENYKGFPIANLIGSFVTLLFGLSLFPIINSEIKNSTVLTSGNVTATGLELSGTVLSSIPIFFALAIIGIAISIVYNSLNDTGLI